MEHDAKAVQPTALRIGPGARLDRVAALVEALARATPGAQSPTRWFDLAELLLAGPRDRVVIDADHFPLEDIGIVRRFLVPRPSAAAEVIGSDRTLPVGRALLALPRVRWHPWPLDLVQLEDLLEPPRAEEPRRSMPAAQTNAAGAELLAMDLRGFDLRTPLGDLAAQVRRTSDALVVLRGAGSLDPKASEALGGEIVRLERSVRSLSLGVERTPKALEDLDLDALVEEELAVLALQSRRAPRVRYLGGEVLHVHADRAALVHTLGVLLELVRALVGTGELVEVRSLSAPDSERAEAARAIVRLRAPAGPLAGIAAAQLFQPNGLGERIQGIGPSELCVLARLCQARGLTLEARAIAGSPPQIEFDLSVPLGARAAKLLAGA